MLFILFSRRGLLVVVVACALAGAFLILRQATRSRINETNAGRIKVGMTIAEVEAILGPERDETGRGFCYMWGRGYRWGRVWLDGRLYEFKRQSQWVSEEAGILVCFDYDDRVNLVQCEPPRLDPEPTLWERLKACVMHFTRM